MWARVKGRRENALLQMRFKAVFLFRPGYVQLLHEDFSQPKRESCFAVRKVELPSQRCAYWPAQS
jgi:hypothetical protein